MVIVTSELQRYETMCWVRYNKKKRKKINLNVVLQNGHSPMNEGERGGKEVQYTKLLEFHFS